MNVPDSLTNTMYMFLSHNWPLVLFGFLSIFFLFLSIIKPSKNFILLFIGFALLAIEFEYQKHLFTKIQTDMIDLIFPEARRFWKYRLVILFLKRGVPLGLKTLGWLSILWAFISRKKPAEIT